MKTCKHGNIETQCMACGFFKFAANLARVAAGLPIIDNIDELEAKFETKPLMPDDPLVVWKQADRDYKAGDVVHQHDSYMKRHPELAREIDEQKKQDQAEVEAFLRSCAL